MLNSINSKKALNFDLDDNLLRINYPNGHYKNGWRDIGKYLKKNGFIHRQYSGYVSEGDVSYPEVNAIIKDMTIEYEWLKECVKQFDVTAVLEEYSLLGVIKFDGFVSRLND